MKTFLIQITFLFAFISSHSQPIRDMVMTGSAIDFNDNSTNDIQYEIWYQRITSKTSDYFIYFKKNTIGVKKAIELTKELCISNGIDFNTPTKDASYLASYITTLNDFQSINTSVSVGGSIISKKWELSKVDKINNIHSTSFLELLLDENEYKVKVYNHSYPLKNLPPSNENLKELSKTEIYKLAFEEFKKSNYYKSDSLFTIYKNKYPNEVYGHYWCFRSKSMIDTTMVNGYAVDDCKSFIRIAELETLKNKPTLITAYGYMAGYSANILKDLPKALSYLKRILEIDPSNLDAQKNAQILEKAIKRL